MRHGLAALVLAALVLPLVPAAGPAMACCRGGGDACACPIELGFSRCQQTTDLAAPPASLALLPPPAPTLGLAPTSEAIRSLSGSPSSPTLAPRVPPPRA